MANAFETGKDVGTRAFSIIDTVKNNIKGFFGGIGGAARTASLSGAIDGNTASLSSEASVDTPSEAPDMLRSFGKGAMSMLGGVGSVIGNTVKGAFEGGKAAFSKTAGGKKLADMAKDIKPLAVSLGNNVLGEDNVEKISDGAGKVKDFFSNISAKVQDVYQQNGIGGVFSYAKDSIAKGAAELGGKINTGLHEFAAENPDSSLTAAIAKGDHFISEAKDFGAGVKAAAIEAKSPDREAEQSKDDGAVSYPC